MSKMMLSIALFVLSDMGKSSESIFHKLYDTKAAGGLRKGVESLGVSIGLYVFYGIHEAGCIRMSNVVCCFLSALVALHSLVMGFAGLNLVGLEAPPRMPTLRGVSVVSRRLVAHNHYLLISRCRYHSLLRYVPQ
jgi:hypothetical protein